MRRPIIAIAAVTGAMALGGSAMAVSGETPLGAPFKADHDDQQAQFSKELAAKLGNGLTADQVTRALEQVHADSRAAEQEKLAKALAASLGVSADQVSSALRKADDEAGDRPYDLNAVLADGLGKSKSEVEKALDAYHEDSGPDVAPPPPGGPVMAPIPCDAPPPEEVAAAAEVARSRR